MTTVPALTDEAALNQYTATGGQTDFNFSFMIFATADIEVYVNGVLKTEVTDYTVKKSGGGSIGSTDLPLDGGKVVFVSGLTADDEVTLNRNIAIARSTGYSVAGAFRADVVNREFTKQLAISQQLRRDIERAIRLSTFDSEGGDLTLPTGRASKLIGFDADGNAALFAGVAEQEVPVSDFMATVLDDADAAAALTTLGVSAFVQTLLNDSDASTALTTLGISAFIQTLLNDSDAPTAQATLGFPTLASGDEYKMLRVNSAHTGYLAFSPVVPTVQRFTSGSGTYYLNYTFDITSGSATAGATYTNNGITFTVYETVSGATRVVMSGSGAPAASGTLTKASGTGDSTLTFSAYYAPKWLQVRGVGGGGGSGGSGTASQTAGGAGGNTTFGSSLLTGNGGAGGGVIGNPGGAGGSATVAAPARGSAFTGGYGAGHGFNNVSNGGSHPGGVGGNTIFGGAAGGSVYGGAGVAGATNTGGGAGGAGTNTNVAASYSGSGGGGGGGFDAIIPSPSATYAYAVGAAGSAGGAGTSGSAGAAGGSGYIEVTEFYN